MAMQNSSDSVVLPRLRPAAAGRTGERPRPVLRSAAQGISHVASPPVLTIACAAAVAGADGRPSAFLSAGLFALVGVVLPLAALVRQWRSGDVSDLEITRRQERLWPLLLTTTCVGIASSLLLLVGAPPSVSGLAAILGVQSLVLLVVTGSWKISVHAASAATTGALIWQLTGRWEPGLVLVALTTWSRLTLRRHSPLQCLAGGTTGAVLMVLLWPLLAG
jgi:membrane-associated phospholipid phosphatase